MTTNTLWLLHLSDVHFNKKDRTDEDPYDLDLDLRDQLEQDVERVREKVGGRIDGVVLTGDIAFAGREAEYEVAREWLEKLTDICRCQPESVWCVPGNHDKDRGVFDKSLNLKNLHVSLRPSDAANVDAMLRVVLSDEEAALTLFRPFEQYNRFAARFKCKTEPHALWWEQRISLNDGSSLILRGANSALVSDWSDDNKANKLILGTLQATARQRADEAVVFMCHHPLDWLMDYDALIPVLNDRARVQLFGHKHLQTIDYGNNCLRIVAGSVQPDRREPRWRPRYNCIGFSVATEGGDRKLVVDLYPRIWSEDSPRFVPDYWRCDGNEHKEYRLDLPAWTPPPPGRITASPRTPPPTPTAGGSGAAVVDPEKTLTYRYLSLSHLVRLEIAVSLKLLREEDEGVSDAVLFERILKRAAKENKLAELWDGVVAASDDAETTNPYRAA